MTQNELILKRLNNEHYLSKIKNEVVKKELRKKILDAMVRRMYNKINRSDVSKYCNVSESTIKRLENGKVYDISIIYNYISLLKDLPNKKKVKVPNWV